LQPKSGAQRQDRLQALASVPYPVCGYLGRSWLVGYDGIFIVNQVAQYSQRPFSPWALLIESWSSIAVSLKDY
jgi:hypothetical protein